MDGFKEILDGPEYFFCERTRCRLKFSVCIQRQDANRRSGVFLSTPFLVCDDCEQGKKNRLFVKKGGMKLSAETKTSIEARDSNKDETVAVPNTRLCECGNPTITPNNPLCPSCMAARANENRRKGKSGKNGPEKTLEKPGGSVSPTAVIVEFRDHRDVLDRITRDAREQTRTVSGQIMWMLKNSPAATEERSHHERDL